MSHRKMTPRGQMSSNGSGPAIMMMPDHIRATFMPNPPLKPLPPTKNKRKQPFVGLAQYIVQFERTPPPPRKEQPTPKELKVKKQENLKEQHDQTLKPVVDAYRKFQQECGGEYEGMNCYNTLFVGRLAYEVTERKLLREFETFGPVKDLKMVKGKDGKSRGVAFVEYDHEEDMKRAYRAADGMKIEGREIVVDVERGHTVPNWLPRRLGGGLGGTRLGAKEKNSTAPGRFDPTRPEAARPPPMPMGGPPMGMGRGRGGPPPPYGGPGGPGYGGRDGPGGRDRPPSGYGDRDGPGGYGGRDGGRGGYGRGGPPPPYGRNRGPPPPPRGGSGRDWDRNGGSRDWDRGGSGRDWNDRKRGRSRSPSPDNRGRRRYY
mmetsp:Transcript_16343/g.22775  ORF Transcript_16343/g.22775 Transcript_16343/m.22775 type:complete len:374 (-) Transcript_16343:450-1571(-)